ncbi:MAG: hypothetical protein H7138_26315 [Myxococcales bacterium]|nr:hypothetical protein [Myxococcales bacterium]
MDAAQFRQLGHALVDWIAELRETVETRPVRSAARPGEILRVSIGAEHTERAHVAALWEALQAAAG